MNGVKTIYRGYQNAIAVYLNGVFGIDVENGVYASGQGKSVYSATNSDNRITFATPVNNCTCSIVVSEQINFTNYSVVKCTSSPSENNLDVSGYSGYGYLCVYQVKDEHGVLYQGLCISSQKTNFAENIINNMNTYVAGEPYAFTVTEITIE